MIIVFDSNVIISAFISSGQAHDVFEYAVENHQVVASPYILREVKEKLTKKLGFSAEDYEAVRRVIDGWIDVRDEPILDLCVTVKADLLITGDKKIRSLREVKYTRIISPGEFWDIERAQHRPQ